MASVIERIRARLAGRVGRRVLAVIVIACALTLLRTHAATMLQPVADAGSAPPAPWHVVGLPGQGVNTDKPYTAFSGETLQGRRVLRVEADRSYGNLVHPLAAGTEARPLTWQWEVELLNAAADLRQRAGDDTTLKVCALFDMPADHVPFVEREILYLARLRSSEPVPAATICYVWDNRLPAGSRLDNAFTRRLRYIVLESGEPGVWHSERRDLAEDFHQLFGDENPGAVPPLLAIAVGADADNTHGHSIGHVSDVELGP